MGESRRLMNSVCNVGTSIPNKIHEHSDHSIILPFFLESRLTDRARDVDELGTSLLGGSN